MNRVLTICLLALLVIGGVVAYRIHEQLNDFLADNGLKAIDAVGQKFDPNLHEAIAHEPNDNVPEGAVVRQTRRGYRYKDRLLRPASVVVSSGPHKIDH